MRPPHGAAAPYVPEDGHRPQGNRRRQDPPGHRPAAGLYRQGSRDGHRRRRHRPEPHQLPQARRHDPLRLHQQDHCKPAGPQRLPIRQLLPPHRARHDEEQGGQLRHRRLHDRQQHQLPRYAHNGHHGRRVQGRHHLCRDRGQRRLPQRAEAQPLLRLCHGVGDRGFLRRPARPVHRIRCRRCRAVCAPVRQGAQALRHQPVAGQQPRRTRLHQRDEQVPGRRGQARHHLRGGRQRGRPCRGPEEDLRQGRRNRQDLPHADADRGASVGQEDLLQPPQRTDCRLQQRQHRIRIPDRRDQYEAQQPCRRTHPRADELERTGDDLRLRRRLFHDGGRHQPDLRQGLRRLRQRGIDERSRDRTLLCHGGNHDQRQPDDQQGRQLQAVTGNQEQGSRAARRCLRRRAAHLLRR